jgi:hypothetical protein
MMELQRAAGDTSEYNMVRAIFLNSSPFFNFHMCATIQCYQLHKSNVAQEEMGSGTMTYARD